MFLATTLLIIGLLLVAYSADRLVFTASILCRTMGVPPLIIGVAVVGVGTSLPEIIVSVPHLVQISPISYSFWASQPF